jgi:3-methyl-2-oxobutanoate hydroxymethyltransferase
MNTKKITVNDIKALKGVRKMIALTAYDYSFARLIDQGGVDIILVGDSLGMVILGETSTQHVTMDDMVRHTRAVRKGVERALLVADMPIGTFSKPESAVKNARRLIDAGAEAVKIEGNGDLVPVIDAMRSAKIEVMGHVGLTPQTTTEFKVKGKNKAEAARILSDAKAVSNRGVFAIVLECIPALLAERITQTVTVPTIGIGAGAATDGQILVMHDLLGLYTDVRPKFVTQVADLASIVKGSVEKFRSVVLEGKFPAREHSFTMNADDLPEK